jgi:hypothetical protein
MKTRLSIHGKWEATVEQHEDTPDTTASRQYLSNIVPRALELRRQSKLRGRGH